MSWAQRAARPSASEPFTRSPARSWCCHPASGMVPATRSAGTKCSLNRSSTVRLAITATSCSGSADRVGTAGRGHVQHGPDDRVLLVPGGHQQRVGQPPAGHPRRTAVQQVPAGHGLGAQPRRPGQRAAQRQAGPALAAAQRPEQGGPQPGVGRPGHGAHRAVLLRPDERGGQAGAGQRLDDLAGRRAAAGPGRRPRAGRPARRSPRPRAGPGALAAPAGSPLPASRRARAPRRPAPWPGPARAPCRPA